MPVLANAMETVESHLHPTPSWDLADHPVPTGREEIWRFTPVKRMKRILSTDHTSASLTWDTSGLGTIKVTSISHEQAREMTRVAPSDRVGALAVTSSTGPAHLLEVPDNFESTEPLTLQLHGNGGDQTVLQHWVIRVGTHARVTLIVRYQGTACLGEYLNVLVGDGAKVNLLFVQDWDADAIHGGQINITVGRDAYVRASQASLGGDLIRLYQSASFDGPGGELEQYGLYFVEAGQHIEHRLFVDHNAPKTRSNVDYRGCLQGQGAHSVWIGDVLIRKVAEDIETYESNKNLVLTDGCQADSVPNLEIETGEIAGAGHSSTTGRFDDEQLFYLKSRGIPDAEARRLVVHGFFAEIVRRIGIPAVNERLMAAIESELERVDLKAVQ